jgi:hypothetical protein
MAWIVELLGPLAATVGAYGLYRLLKLYYGEYTSPLRDLPGPKSSSLIYGNMKEIWAAVSDDSYPGFTFIGLSLGWMAGKVGCSGEVGCRIWTHDPIQRTFQCE